MSLKDPIYVDASQPADLHHAGNIIGCHTLQEAVIAWHALEEGVRQAKSTFIALPTTGQAFKASDIVRLHYVPKPG